MTQTANNYGTVLFELGVEKETVEEMKRIFSLTGELPRVLDCPVVSGREKHRLIEQLFPKEVWNFLKEMCDHGNVSEMEDVFKAYTRCYDEANGILKTVMYCAGTPDEEQLAQIKAYLAAKHHRETDGAYHLHTAGTDRRICAGDGRSGGRLQRPGADQEFRTKIDMEVMTWVP